MAHENDEVDFDFFDTPRNKESTSPKYWDKKPPPSPTTTNQDDTKYKKYSDDRNARGGKQPQYINKTEDHFDDDSYSDSFSSDTDSETPRVEKGNGNKVNNEHFSGKRDKGNIYSDSSSAYSNSDYSSDDSFEKINHNNNNRRKEKIEVTVPKVQMNAWSNDFSQADDDKQDDLDHKKKMNGKGSRRSRSHTGSSESDSSCERESSTHVKSKRESGKSAKHKEGYSRNKARKPLRSTSSSYSNNSDITDVSPLQTPEISPRAVRKHYYDAAEKENGQYDDVQYKGQEKNVDIKLESDQIDLSILMRCMADIDKDKQQRLKANTRHVMFAPPTVHDKGNQNFTFSMGRAKIIERENQRLLKQIMQHVGTGPGKVKTPTKHKKPAEPVVPRLTPSAVNRMREQRRIEMENMQMLNRLQRVRATSGMSRKEQLQEFEKQAAYGIPTGTVIIGGEGARYDTMPTRDLGSSMTTQRSRPSSAKSNISVPGGRRSRPSSAKSNASVVSNASMRSNMSMRSNVSRKSNVSIRSTGRSKKGDNRPEWDDRFAYS